MLYACSYVSVYLCHVSDVLTVGDFDVTLVLAYRSQRREVRALSTQRLKSKLILWACTSYAHAPCVPGLAEMNERILGEAGYGTE